MSELPKGWAWAAPRELTANEVYALGIGPFGSDLKVSDYRQIGVPLVFVRNIRAELFGGQDTKYISPEKAQQLQAHRVQAGDVLITKMGEPPGDSCVYPAFRPDGIVTADCIRWRVNPLAAEARFVVYAVRSRQVQSQIVEITRGVAQRKISLERFSGIKVPIAPLPEQLRIVEALDSYSTRVNEATALLERVQRNLKRYRSSVLKAAVEGRLVPTEAALARAERRGYEPASALLQRIFVERRRRWEQEGRRGKYEEPAPPDTKNLPELSEGWCWAKVRTVGDVQLGRQRAPQHHSGPNMRPYLRVANVFEDKIDTSDIMFMNFSNEEYETYCLKNGDILLNEGQSPHLVGRPAIYRGEVPGACFTNTLVRFRPHVGIDPAYALIVFRAQLHSLRFMKIAKITTNIAHLGAERFAEVEFPVPPIEEQRRIVRAVENALSLIANSEQLTHTSTMRLARLRQSILKWAFEGKLVDQDPADEPAAALLARLQAEPASAAAPRRRRSTSQP